MTDDIKINDMVVVAKLSTGEIIMALCTQIYEKAIAFAFPYEIVEREVKIEGSDEFTKIPVLIKYCPYTANRHFVINSSDIVFSKDASVRYSEVFIKTAATFDNEEFKEFVENLKENSTMTYSSIEEIEDVLNQLQKKVGKNFDVMFDAPKTIQ